MIFSSLVQKPVIPNNQLASGFNPKVSVVPLTQKNSSWLSFTNKVPPWLVWITPNVNIAGVSIKYTVGVTNNTNTNPVLLEFSRDKLMRSYVRKCLCYLKYWSIILLYKIAAKNNIWIDWFAYVAKLFFLSETVQI